MTPQRRNAITRLSLTALTLAVAGLTLWEYPWLDSPIGTGLMIVGVAVIANLGVPVTYGTVTFAPVAMLMAYLALGPERAWLVLTVGLALGGIGCLLAERSEPGHHASWWVRLAGHAWPIAHNGLSLLVAAWSYRELGGQIPLSSLLTLDDVLPVIAVHVMYLLIYAALLALDVWLAGFSVLRYVIRNRRVLLAVMLLPTPLAPLTAVALNQLGLPAFALLLAGLLSVVAVVNRLAIAQASLRRRVRQLSSFSAVGRAVRTSLELEALLEVIYLQTASPLQVRDFVVALVEPETGTVRFPFAVRDSRRERIPPRKGYNGPIEWVIKHGQPLLIEQDVASALDRMSLTQPKGQPRSWMGVPLLATDRTLGCMAAWLPADDPHKRLFTAEDLELFNNVAIQASVAVENALLYQDMQRHAEKLATLSQTSAAMSTSLDPERVLELVSRSAIKVAGCAKSALYLLGDGDPRRLELTQAYGFSQTGADRLRILPAPLSPAERVAVLEEGRVVSVRDVSTLSGQVAPVLSELAEAEGVRAYAYLPLNVQNEPIGLLGLYYDQPHQLEPTEIELLETFTNQAAMAVANARVFQRVDVELARRVDQIVMLAEINRQLGATLDLERVGELLIDSAMQACGASAAMLVLAEEGGQGLKMLAWRGYSPADPRRAPHIVARELADRVLVSGQAYLEPDLGGDGDGQAPDRMRSQLSVPIAIEDNTIGAIALESAEPNAFREEDVAFVSQLASQAAIAIQNAELYRHASEVGERLHAVLDASLDGLLMIDARSRIVMTNTRMSDFWDFARADFDKRSPEEFLADPLTALGEGLGYGEGELIQLIEQAQRDPDMPPQTDLYITKSHARQRFVERTGAPVRDEQRNFIGLLLIFRDVTEQKKLEEARETLTGMIVHDLRGPLTAILGSIRLVEEMLPDMQSVVRQALGASDRAVKKLLNLVSTLLDLYRLEDEDLVIDLAPEALPPVLEAAAEQLLPLAMELEATIDIEAPPDLPEAYIDRDLIDRVAQNLIDNALKFTPPRKAVKVRMDVVPRRPDTQVPVSRAKRPPAGAISPDQMLRIQVIDNGPGVLDDHKERVFDRFSQVHGQTGRRHGTGLGLAFCRLAVEAHGGRIWIEDGPQGGSIFQFTVPISAAPTEATE